MSLSAALMLALAQPVAVHAAPVQRSFAGALAAVDSCFASTGMRAIDPVKLAADGWTEQKIDGIEKSPTLYRLFAKPGSGGMIMFNFGPDGLPHCHVMVLPATGGTDALQQALTDHLGATFPPPYERLGPDTLAMKLPGRPFVVALNRRPGDKNFMADIHIMAVEDDR